ncbi:ABC transporter substrate-binding protein [Pseudomonas sp. LRF_L74]|uniref:ABC transporter substrate-binding protein n=1 Tax=Pseudomonas sp. LRF_L74 TaxID=3369422 RepID=UPI003F5DAACA
MTSASRRSFLWKAFVVSAVGCGFPLARVLAKSDDLARVVLRIANAKGSDETFFSQAGVDDTPYQIRPVRLGQASLSAEALNAGAYDFALQSNISSVFLPAQTPIRLAGFIGFRGEAFKLYVRKGAGIDTPGQIKGKRVAFMRGGPLHLMLLEVLKQEKLTLADIRPVALSAQDSASAFISGDVDVVLAGMYAPSYQIEQSGGELLVGGEHFPGFANNNGYAVAVHRQVLTDPAKKQAVSDYIKRLKETWSWLDQHEDLWAAELGRLFGVPAQFILKHRPRPYQTEILASSDGRSRLDYVARSFLDGGAIPALPDTSRLWDDELESLIPAT